MSSFCYRLLPFFLFVFVFSSSSSFLVSAQQAPTLNSVPLFYAKTTDNDNNDDSQLVTPSLPSLNDTGYRTDVCDRQRWVLDGSVELRNALQGLNLTVAMTNYKGVPNEEKMFALDDDGKIPMNDPGLFVVILDEIARRAGFEWRNTFRAITPPPLGVSWSDLLQWEVQHYDIAADYWAKSAQRMSRGVSFPHGWYDGSIVMVTREIKEVEPFNFWSFLVPFEWTVWFGVVAAIFITGITYFFMERLNAASDDRALENKPLTTLFITALTFTGHFEFQPNTVPSRMLTMSWGFWAMIILSAYTANMASFLVSQSAAPTRISTIEEALLTSTPLCVQRGSVMDDFLTEKHPELNLVRKDTEQGMFEGLGLDWYGGAGGCGALLTNLGTYDIYESQVATNNDCSLGSDRRVLLNLPAGYATAVDSAILCTSLVSYVFDVHLQEMRQDGFIDEAWDNHVQKISTKTCVDNQEGSGLEATSSGRGFSLSMKEMGGIFLTHYIMSVIAVVISLGQYLHTKYKKPEKKLRPINLDVSIRSMPASFRWSSNRKNLVSSRNVGGGGEHGSRENGEDETAESSGRGFGGSLRSFRWSSARK